MKKNSIQKRQRNPRPILLLLSFFLPVLMLMLAWGIIQFWPIGERSPLTIDLYHQYVSFISELRRKIMNFESLFYSWRVGLGTNFFALLAYYAASPLNLLLPLFPKEHITEAVSFLTLAKIGFAGFSFAYLLMHSVGFQGLFSVRSKEHIEDLGSEDFGGDGLIVAFAVAYALCGFQLAFSWDIMWLDVTATLPLVILGVNKLIREGRVLLYSLTLAFCLFVNYYMAFFVCVFTGLYFFVAYFTARAEEEELAEQIQGERKKSELSLEERFAVEEKQVRFWPIAIRFAIVTLVAVAISAFMLFPTALSLAHTSASGDNFPSSWNLKFSAFDFLTHQLMGIAPSIRRGLPNIYNGILVFTLLPLYVISTKIRLKEKLPHLLLLAFLFISFNSNVLDFLWHGMHYPNQLPYRYSFLFSFLLLLISFRTLTVIREFSSKALVFTTGIGIAVAILAEEINTDLLTRGFAYINLLFFFSYLLMMLLIWKKNYFRTICLLLTIVFLGEIAINTIMTVSQIAENEVYTSRTTFIEGMDEIETLINTAKEDAAGDFYRMEILPAKTTNDGALYGYPGFTLFSSTSREKTAKFMRKFAYHGNNINSYKYVASTALANSLFGIEYLLLKNGATRDVLLEEVATAGEMTLLKNPYALDVGVAANQSFTNWNTKYSNPFQNWNDFLLEMADLDPVFFPITPQVIEGANFNPSTGDGETGLQFTPENSDRATLMRLEIPVDQAQYMYLAFDVTQTTKVTITTRNQSDTNVVVDGDLLADDEEGNSESQTVANTDANSTVKLNENRSIHFFETFDIGYVAPGDVVEISFEQTSEKASNVTIYGATMDQDVYLDTMEKLQERSIDVTNWFDNGLEASYTAPEDGLLYLSIPYDSAWKAYIDGEEVAIESIGDEALLAVPTRAGEHSLRLEFIPEGFTIGLIATGVGILLLVLLALDRKFFYGKRLSKRKEKHFAKYKKDWEEKEGRRKTLEERLLINESDASVGDEGNQASGSVNEGLRLQKLGAASVYRMPKAKGAENKNLSSDETVIQEKAEEYNTSNEAANKNELDKKD